MKKFKIVKEEIKTDYMEMIKVKAVDENEKEIFGARCEVYRDKSLVDFSWKEWKINWPTTGAGTYEEKLPYFEVIRAGMEELKKRVGVKEV